MAGMGGKSDTTSWEKNIKAKLKKHEARAAALHEELRKEMTAISHLNKILARIKDHRKMSRKLEAAVLCIQEHPEQNGDFEDRDGESDDDDEEEMSQNCPSIDFQEFMKEEVRESATATVSCSTTSIAKVATNLLMDGSWKELMSESRVLEGLAKGMPLPPPPSRTTTLVPDPQSPDHMPRGDTCESSPNSLPNGFPPNVVKVGGSGQEIAKEDNEPPSQKCGKQCQIFSCGECGKRFLTEQNLRRHDVVHAGPSSGEKALFHTCYKCEKRFASRRDLQRHNTTHTGEEIFNCVECDKAFGTKRALKIHKMWHHME